MPNFGQFLKVYRFNKGLSQAELARDLDLSQATIASYELGERKPRQNRLIKMARYFSVSPNELLGYDPHIDFYSVKGVVTIPVLNRLPYDVSTDNENYVMRYTQLPDDVDLLPDSTFVFIAQDDAMKGYSRIQKEDSLIVTPNENIKDGDIVIVNVQQENAIVRRIYYPDNSSIALLIADNAYHRPITIPRREIILRGKVVQIFLHVI
ncbi:LexA family protein [Marinococcus luteus]|uniref:LexA family protein n=1 Tax=Marinococcus luteus TaxID=1122204 RepID=UPI002ACD0388|nr:XRE family transcriptional regulator [Marinococcus luteus]MDZ5781895.1 XRE family transcriptional regulator [Marinococcus luteus]